MDTIEFELKGDQKMSREEVETYRRLREKEDRQIHFRWIMILWLIIIGVIVIIAALVYYFKPEVSGY